MSSATAVANPSRNHPPPNPSLYPVHILLLFVLKLALVGMLKIQLLIDRVFGITTPFALGTLFQPIIDQLPMQTGITLGQTIRFPMTRDFAREGFVIVVQPTVSGVAATIAPEGIFSLIKRVRLFANDGGQNRALVDSDSMSIVQRHLQYNNNIDTATLSAFSNAFGSATQKTFRIPHFFPPGELEDPARSMMLANFPRFNNDPQLEIQIGSQADVDTNGAPTFAISALRIWVIDLKRYVTSDAWQFLKTDFVTSEQAFTQNQAAQRYTMPIPGWHFACGMRPYSSATALGDISQADGLFRISALNVTERTIQTLDLLSINQFSQPSDVGAAANGTQRAILGTTQWFDWLTDLTGASVTNLDTLLNSNPYVALGTGPQVIGDINGGAGKKIVFMHDRCYGDTTPGLLLPRLVAQKK